MTHRQKLDDRIAFLEKEIRGVDRDRRWALRVPLLVVVACPLGLVWSWAGAFVVAACILAFWGTALYILKFRREENEGQLEDVRAERERELREG